MPLPSPYEELSREVDRMRARLHLLENKAMIIEFLDAKMETVTDKITELEKGQIRMPLLESKIDAILQKMKEDQARGRWVMGLIMTIIGILLGVVLKFWK